MADGVEIADVVADVKKGSDAISRLAQDAAQFGEVIKAFRAHDSEAWQRILDKAKLLAFCHWVYEWVCSKECVRICILLAGPPRERRRD
jgi:hypothetical protein